MFETFTVTEYNEFGVVIRDTVLTDAGATASLIFGLALINPTHTYSIIAE